MAKLGVCFVGLNGGVSTTSIIAALAIGKKLQPANGLYTETLMSPVKDGKLDRNNQFPIKDKLSLLSFDELVFAGWDIENDSGNLYESAKKLEIVKPEIIDSVKSDLQVLKPWPGVFSSNYLRTLDGKFILKGKHDEKAEIIRSNIQDFKKEQNLESVLVVNAASTEAYHEESKVHASVESFEKGLATNSSEIGPAQIYAYAALKEGCPYINFTPSLAAEIPALRELANKTKTPIAGKDGKTGQTMLKTAIAPIFRLKNLYVNGWFSTNILGNKDGLVLDEPGSLEAKRKTKAGVLDQILGYSPYHKVDIQYYPPRGDNKEAWDNIDFTGMLGGKMQLKINFLCKDSVLAAGSVLDLIRFMYLAKQKGEYGVQEQLGFFFKSPHTIDGREPIHDFFKQEGVVKDWLREKVYRVGYRK